jgi:putative membrane protein
LTVWVIVSLSLYATVYIGHTLKLGLALDAEQPWRIVYAGAAIGLINAIIMPICKLLTLPVHCLTLGISTLIINVVLFYLLGQQHLGFEVTGPLGAVFGTVCVSFISSVLGTFLPKGKK